MNHHTNTASHRKVTAETIPAEANWVRLPTATKFIPVRKVDHSQYGEVTLEVFKKGRWFSKTLHEIDPVEWKATGR